MCRVVNDIEHLIKGGVTIIDNSCFINSTHRSNFLIIAKKRLWRLLKLGVPEWIVHEVVYFANHYKFVATKIISKNVVSKEKLTSEA